MIFSSISKRLAFSKRFFCTNKEQLTRLQQIKNTLNDNKYVLFMKGIPQMPGCGFSNFVVELLKFYKIRQYKAIDILADPQLKEQVKLFSEWPTYPQLWVDGKFIGGFDILNTLHKQGKLKELFVK